jgi:hypothetical protein
MTPKSSKNVKNDQKWRKWPKMTKIPILTHWFDTFPKMPDFNEKKASELGIGVQNTSNTTKGGGQCDQNQGQGNKRASLRSRFKYCRFLQYVENPPHGPQIRVFRKSSLIQDSFSIKTKRWFFISKKRNNSTRNHSPNMTVRELLSFLGYEGIIHRVINWRLTSVQGPSWIVVLLDHVR